MTNCLVFNHGYRLVCVCFIPLKLFLFEEKSRRELLITFLKMYYAHILDVGTTYEVGIVSIYLFVFLAKKSSLYESLGT